MPKGGARTRSGPPPDPTSQKSMDGDWVLLPVAGRTDPPPAWPLPTQSDRESAIWDALWVKPQAIEWSRLGQEHYVGIYVRRLAEAEVADSAVNLSTLVRQMSDELGLTVAGMLRNRWRLERPDDAGSKAPATSSARNRLKVVSGGGA